MLATTTDPVQTCHAAVGTLANLALYMDALLGLVQTHERTNHSDGPCLDLRLAVVAELIERLGLPGGEVTDMALRLARQEYRDRQRRKEDER